MDFGMETSIFLAYAAGILVLYFFGRFLLVPVKIFLKLLANSLLGGMALAALSIIGESFGISLPLNPLNAVLVGLTGLPGILGLLVFFNLTP